MTLHLGDCLDVLASMEADSVDSVVTDPPYGLRFMSKTWDHGVPGERYWSEVRRVLKSGAHLVAFGGTRTHHRLMVAIEDAGFEIRDCLMWLHGQGFPKGKGQLKPAWEPIILARKPAPAPWLNVDGCRIGNDLSRGDRYNGRAPLGSHGYTNPSAKPDPWEVPAGRWPANVVLSHEPPDEDGNGGCREVGTKRVKSESGSAGNSRPETMGYHGAVNARQVFTYKDADGYETTAAFECQPNCAVRLLDEQGGERRAAYGKQPTADVYAGATVKPGMFGGNIAGRSFSDTGGASRFFYCAKASPAERRPYNDHPTVKPLALMQWLCRLVTPKGGLILDPFCGSGSTLIAADREGFEAIGIDSDSHAIEIATRRLADEAGPLFAPAEMLA